MVGTHGVCVACKFSVVDICSISRSDRVGSVEVRNLVMGPGCWNILSQRMKLGRFCWLGYVLCSEHSSTVPCLIFRSSRRVEDVTWRSTDVLGTWTENVWRKVSLCRYLHVWDPGDPPGSWLKTSKNMTANRKHCRSCWHFLSNKNDWKMCVWTFRLYSVCSLLLHLFLPLYSPTWTFILSTATFNAERKTAFSGVFPFV